MFSPDYIGIFPFHCLTTHKTDHWKCWITIKKPLLNSYEGLRDFTQRNTQAAMISKEKIRKCWIFLVFSELLAWPYSSFVFVSLPPLLPTQNCSKSRGVDDILCVTFKCYYFQLKYYYSHSKHWAPVVSCLNNSIQHPGDHKLCPIMIARDVIMQPSLLPPSLNRWLSHPLQLLWYTYTKTAMLRVLGSAQEYQRHLLFASV